MLDKRCKYRIRILSKFYLFIKHKSIYYAYYPEYKITKSTGVSEIRLAYSIAYEFYQNFGMPKLSVWKQLPTRKLQTDFNRIHSYLKSDNLTSTSIINLMNTMLKEGKSAKSINNYVHLLKRAYNGTFPDWKPLSHTAVYRRCFPIISFYRFYQSVGNDRLLNLAFFAMTTGVRVSEIKTCYPVTINNKRYLQINGTKTSNAVRRVPMLPETEASYYIIQGGFRSSAYKESVVKSGSLCGFNEHYIQNNHIVFHSFRKMFKTLLESCNVGNNWVEFFMGHSQTSSVNQLYFIADSADDTVVYNQTITALRRFVD